MSEDAPVYIVMGVSGAGKTTVAINIARALKLPFHDADDFHPPENVEKMAAGVSLQDEDRWPWLMKLNSEILEWARSGGAVLACSALKKSYRDVLSKGTDSVSFIYLRGTAEIIGERIQKRQGHYMPPSLLTSQLKTLEEPEDAIVVDVNGTIEEVTAEIIEKIKK